MLVSRLPLVAVVMAGLGIDGHGQVLDAQEHDWQAVAGVRADFLNLDSIISHRL